MRVLPSLVEVLLSFLSVIRRASRKSLETSCLVREGKRVWRKVVWSISLSHPYIIIMSVITITIVTVSWFASFFHSSPSSLLCPAALPLSQGDLVVCLLLVSVNLGDHLERFTGRKENFQHNESDLNIFSYFLIDELVIKACYKLLGETRQVSLSHLLFKVSVMRHLQET